jgi:quercetin dioxygenase-like cupin family protein
MRAALVAAALTLLSAMTVHAQQIEVRPNGSAPAALGTPETFAGHAVINSLFPATEITRASLGLVSFAPSARTVWHTHPSGQLLIVTTGQGWVQQDGRDRQVINPGDVVWVPAGVKHWHGATQTSPMSHLAVSYMVNGKNVDWMEHVSDEQYRQQTAR